MHRAPLNLTRRVDFSQTDAAGLMHFSSYFTFMEAAEAAVFRQLQIPLLQTHAGVAIGFPRVDVDCRFRRPLYFDDEVRIEARLQAIESNRLYWAFRFFNAAGELTARGHMTTACVRRRDDHSLESIPLPPEMQQALAAWAEPDKPQDG